MLIIYAHPNKDGHSGYYLSEVKRLLTEKKIEFEVLDLYLMKYDPVLKNDELDGKTLSKETLEIQDKIRKSKGLVFIYPTWWQSVPAILKGFFDKTLTPGFAYKYEGFIPKGLLHGKKAVVFTSTGAPGIFNTIVKKNRSLTVVTVDTLRFCGIKTKGYNVGSARKLTDSQKTKIEKRVKSGVKYLSNL